MQIGDEQSGDNSCDKISGGQIHCVASKCAIIVPVYNAFQVAADCLSSVLRYTDRSTRIIVVDDASAEGDFKSYFNSKCKSKHQIEFYRNEHNLGFVKSCNYGMRLASKQDVLLLNSDTIVTPGWLEKICLAANSSTSVGTVTPLTNNGVICSVPNFCQDNKVPEGYSINSFAALVERASRRLYPELPTCVGFCVLIKRCVLDKVGLFDEENFGLGYGEENDLSCRAQAAGFKDILDDSSYVYHRGSMSFGGKKDELSARNTETLRKLHPQYFQRVAEFIPANPLRMVQTNIYNQMVCEWFSSKRCSVLHLVHNGPKKERYHPLGGTEYLVQDLITYANECAHWTLVPSADGYVLTAHMPGFDREYLRFRANTKLSDIINTKRFDFIHLHHSLRFDANQLRDALLSHNNFFISVHDYHLLCPRVFFQTVDLRVCNGFECVKSCAISLSDITDLRKRARELFGAAKKVFCFSESSKRIIQGVLGVKAEIVVSEHGIELEKQIEDKSTDQLSVRANSEQSQLLSLNPLKLLVLGPLVRHKGSDLIFELLRLNELSNGVKLEWHVFGDEKAHDFNNVVWHSSYKRGEYPDKLKSISPHLVLALSNCPETFGLTIEESVNCSIPVLVSPFGAPAERVRKYNYGWVCESYEQSAVLNLLEQISSNPAEYQSVIKSVRSAKIKSSRQEVLEQQAIYLKILANSDKVHPADLLLYLENYTWVDPLGAGKLRRLYRRLLSKLNYFLPLFRRDFSYQLNASDI